jgi:hypothetical protein
MAITPSTGGTRAAISAASSISPIEPNPVRYSVQHGQGCTQ